MRVYGAAGNPGEVGRTAYAYGGKLYSSAGSILYFSDVNDATRWNREDVDRAGAGFLNASTQDSGAQELVGVQEYQGDRKSVVSGKSVSVRVDLGGRRIIKKKKKTKKITSTK